MVYTDQTTKFVDKDGLTYLVNQLKEESANISPENIDLSSYVTRDELQAALDELDIDIDLSSYATKEELEQALDNINLTGFATEDYVDTAIANAQLGGEGTTVDLSSYAKKSDLDAKADADHTHTMEDIIDYEEPDLSEFALKTDIPVVPSLEGYATTAYVDEAVANIEVSGGGDMSNYYTKGETYNKEEIDSAIANIEGGGSDNSCDLYDAVVANGGAIKEYVTTQYTDETYKASYLIENKDELGTIKNNDNGNIYFHFNTNKTTTDLKNEFSGLSDFNKQNVFHILASNVPPEEWLSREKMITHDAVYFIGVLITSSSSDIYLCRYNIVKTWIDNAVRLSTLTNYETGANQPFGLASHLTYYLCSGALVSEVYNINKKTFYKYEENNPIWNNGTVFNDSTGRGRYYLYNHHAINNSTYDAQIGNFVYVPDNCSCEWGDGTVYNNTITSLEFSKHILDTYVGYNTFTGTKAVNYTMAEWGEKLDNSVGEDGKDGADGKDGFSPTVSIIETDNGHTVEITDVNGTQSFIISNGVDGIDGVTPEVDLSNYYNKEETYSKTEVDALISNSGSSSTGGSSSGGGSGITYAYDTEIDTGDKWYDGRTIYMRIFHIAPLESAPSDYITYANYHSQTPFFDTIVSAETTWQSTSNQQTFNGNVMQAFTPASGSSGSAAVSAVNVLLKKTCWTQPWKSTKTFAITVTRGQDMYNFGCDVFVKYVK